MKYSQMICVAATLASGCRAFYSGFNIAANKADGSCRSQSDWEFAFNKIASFPGSFKNVRLYASSDCNTLINAVPAAIDTDTKLLVGIWTEDSTHYEAEKQALVEAIQQHGSDWILAVSVGSEDLYRGDTDANALASQIYDVRGMLGSLGAGSKSVGHVDTWTAWVNSSNTAVIEAVDWLGNDVYPYWQGVATDDGAASDAYWDAVHNVKAVSQGKDVWVTETGSPISGATVGNAVPSIQESQTYWKQVACKSMSETDGLNFFWYDLDDFSASPSFAVVDTNYNLLFDLTCS